MKFDDILSDDNVLKASGFLFAGPALGQLVLHKPFAKLMTPSGNFDSGFGSMGRVGLGISCASLSARDLALGFNPDAKTKTKKNALKILGLRNVAFSAWLVDGVKNKKEIKDLGYAFAGAHALVGALALFKGFKPE